MLQERTEYKRLIRKKALLMLMQESRLSTQTEKSEFAKNLKKEQVFKHVIKMHGYLKDSV